MIGVLRVRIGLPKEELPLARFGSTNSISKTLKWN